MKFRMISAKELNQYLARKDYLLIDIREKENYQKEHIPNAIWADWETLEKEIDAVLLAQEEEIHWIILYCDKGNTSLLAARDLARLGYAVMSLNGGYLKWKKMH